MVIKTIRKMHVCVLLWCLDDLLIIHLEMLNIGVLCRFRILNEMKAIYNILPANSTAKVYVSVLINITHFLLESGQGKCVCVTVVLKHFVSWWTLKPQRSHCLLNYLSFRQVNSCGSKWCNVFLFFFRIRWFTPKFYIKDYFYIFDFNSWFPYFFNNIAWFFFF